MHLNYSWFSMHYYLKNENFNTIQSYLIKNHLQIYILLKNMFSKCLLFYWLKKIKYLYRFDFLPLADCN